MKPLCYPVIHESGMRVVILTEDNRIIESHVLGFGEACKFVETAIQALQRLYVQEKCKCK